jgi:terminase, large subunit
MLSLIRDIHAAVVPPKDLSLSEWADTYGYLSQETSSSPGKLQLYGYQKGLADACTDPSISQIAVMKSARVGFSVVLAAAIGYFIQHDPSSILMVLPREEDAENFSRGEVANLLRDTPILAELTGDLKSRGAQQRIGKRVFSSGSSITFVGANAPGGFRRLSARCIFLDEVDGMAASSGNEGSPVQLAIKRGETYHNRLVLLGSTPTIAGRSQIERSFLEGDMRYFHVKCPVCHAPQPLRMENMQWDKDADGHSLPATAHMICSENQCVITEDHKPDMIEHGEWVATRPMVAGKASFFIWSGYSLAPQARWENIAREFLAAKKEPLLLQSFKNLTLGEVWEDRGESIEGHTLLNRRENYSPQALPIGVHSLSAGVDVQGSRLEAMVMGWGAADESWICDYIILNGDPASPQIWAELDHFLAGKYHREDGQELKIHSTAIDSGGNHTSQVIAYCKPVSLAVYSRLRAGLDPIRSGRSDHLGLMMASRFSLLVAIAGRSRFIADSASRSRGPGMCISLTKIGATPPGLIN